MSRWKNIPPVLRRCVAKKKSGCEKKSGALRLHITRRGVELLDPQRSPPPDTSFVLENSYEEAPDSFDPSGFVERIARLLRHGRHGRLGWLLWPTRGLWPGLRAGMRRVRRFRALRLLRLRRWRRHADGRPRDDRSRHHDRSAWSCLHRVFAQKVVRWRVTSTTAC